MKNLYEKLLIEYCDALISLQDRGRDKAFHGGIFCRACKMIHGRCPDAVYGFLTAAKITGDKKYVRAAKNVFDYGENMFCSDGSMYNDAQANWRYTSTFHLVSLIEAVNTGKELLGSGYTKKFISRAKSISEWLFENLDENSPAHINYPCYNGYAMALAGRFFGEEKYSLRAEKLISYAMAHITENGLLYGESLPHDRKSPKGALSVDIGYNVEESIPALVKYAYLTGDESMKEKLVRVLEAHLEFMFPDGGWDNSFGVRNNKWTYWGSRTSDGCAPAYLLMADRNPAFAEAALRNTEMLEKCSSEGFLYGGPQYKRHGEHACVHHAFEKINSLAFVLENVDEKYLSPRRCNLPADEDDGVRYYPEILTYKMAKGDYRATVTDSDFNVFFSWHATGGTLTALYGKKSGPMIMGSVTDYKLVEPTNMQQSLDIKKHRSLVPRFSVERNGTEYCSSYYTKASMHCEKTGEDACEIVVTTGLTSVNNEDAEDRPQIRYRLSEKGMNVSANNAAGLKYILPLISGKCLVSKGKIEKTDAVFFLTGGFCATEYTVLPDSDGSFEITVTE